MWCELHRYEQINGVYKPTVLCEPGWTQAAGGSRRGAGAASSSPSPHTGLARPASLGSPTGNVLTQAKGATERRDESSRSGRRRRGLALAQACPSLAAGDWGARRGWRLASHRVVSGRAVSGSVLLRPLGSALRQRPTRVSLSPTPSGTKSVDHRDGQAHYIRPSSAGANDNAGRGGAVAAADAKLIFCSPNYLCKLSLGLTERRGWAGRSTLSPRPADRAVPCRTAGL